MEIRFVKKLTSDLLRGGRQRRLAAGMKVSKPIGLRARAALRRRMARDTQAPQPMSMPAPQIVADESLDLIVIANLRKLEAATGRAILAQLLASFSTVTPSRFAALRVAIATGDAFAINMAAHTLKGSSATVGARRMARLCGDLEMLSQTDDLTHAASMLVSIEIEFAYVRMALEQAIGKV
jgi:HPt (histidine-containing phosphotransfer) domain-containing protein